MNKNWVDGFARSLVQHAARKAPASLAQRLQEEWLADFEERKGRMARLRFGVGCCWATKVIAHEYLEPKVATATATAAGGSTVATSRYSRPDYSFLSGRTVAILGIAGLHALIVYAFATGLVQKAVVVFTDPIPVIPDPPRVIEPPPPLPPPQFVDHTHFFVDPGPRLRSFDDDKVSPAETTTVLEQLPPTGPANPPQPTTVNRVGGGPGKNFPNTADYYPPAEIRGGITGTSTVRVCTDERGRLTADPTLETSSGSAGLDKGALRLAKAGSGRYRPTTEDGRPVDSCYPFRVTFSMKN